MSRWLLLAGLVLGSAASSSAQEDWRRYFPLAVGNVWEYEGLETVPNTRYEIVGERMVDGRFYFDRRVQEAYPGGPVTTRMDVVRYDSAGYVVTAFSPEADTLALDPCTWDWFSRPLAAPDGATLPCGPSSGADSVRVEHLASNPAGGWPQPLPPFPADSSASFRAFFVDALWSYFEQDLGPVLVGNLWGLSLHYARIAGQTRGTPSGIFTSEAPAPASPSVAIRLASNPSADGLTFSVHGAGPVVQYRVVDAVGRVVDAGSTTSAREVHLRLAPGLYAVEATSEAGRAVSRAVVVR